MFQSRRVLIRRLLYITKVSVTTYITCKVKIPLFVAGKFRGKANRLCNWHFLRR